MLGEVEESRRPPNKVDGLKERLYNCHFYTPGDFPHAWTRGHLADSKILMLIA